MKRYGAAAGAAIALIACFSKPQLHHRPSDAAGDVDGPPDVLDSAAPVPNYMFVTSTTYLPGMLMGVQQADSACQARASKYSLPGHYVAWISTSAGNAKDRLGSARGWVRPDGLPFADTVADLVAGKVFYPPRIAEDGSDVGTGAYVATGTQADGTDHSGADCANFGSDGAMTYPGFADGGTAMWTDGGVVLGCTNPMHVYCFGTDHATPVSVAPANGPRAFLSGPVPINAGPNSLDAACATEAAGLGTFKAFIATATASPLAHVGSNPAQPWVRFDNVHVTSDFVTFTAPLDELADGTYLNANAATGALQPTGNAVDDCLNWASGSNFADYGQSGHSTSKAFYAGNMMPCGGIQHVYCVQTP